MEKITVKPHTKAFLFALLIASIYVFAYAVKGIVLLFSFEHDEPFWKLSKSKLDCREVEATKNFLLFSIFSTLAEN